VAFTDRACFDPARALAMALLHLERGARAGGNRVSSSAGMVVDGLGVN
jgi:hypothetical protein